MDTVTPILDIFLTHIRPRFTDKKNKKVFDKDLVWSNYNGTVVWYSHQQIFIRMFNSQVEIIAEGKPIPYDPTLTKTQQYKVDVGSIGGPSEGKNQ